MRQAAQICLMAARWTRPANGSLLSPLFRHLNDTPRSRLVRPFPRRPQQLRCFNQSSSLAREVPAEQIEQELLRLQGAIARGELDGLPLHDRQRIFREVDDLQRQLDATQRKHTPAHSPFSRQGNQRPRRSFSQFTQTWNTSPGFRRFAIGCAGSAVLFFFYNQENVPITGRRRFNFIKEDWEKQMGFEAEQQVRAQYVGRTLPEQDSRVVLVNKVVARLAPASGLSDWTVTVIDDKTQLNAFVGPSGNVCVFTGILPICQDEEGLATVVSHELAHVVAHHAAERLSSNMVVYGLVIAALSLFDAGVTGYALLQSVSNIAFLGPSSRREESEADQIGLTLMARTCYNPAAAIGFWERMMKAQQVQPPEWASTHPSHQSRIADIQRWLPKAYEEAESAGCRIAQQHFGAFSNTAGLSSPPRQIQVRWQ